MEEQNKKFKRIDRDFALDLMSVPTVSRMEDMLADYIDEYAQEHGIAHWRDSFGNVYLTKGELSEGEYYPLMTAHIDSVQDKHRPFIERGERIRVIEEEQKGKIILKGDGYGLGADDKCGVLIALTCFQYTDKLKATFFRQEENGCKGSDRMDVSFFDNVGYVIGFDSPELNRSAWCISSQMMFTKDFYLNHIKEICDKHGRTRFLSEPYTDIKNIRIKTPIQCMNFGSGYYYAHTDNEYLVLEEVDECVELALDLIDGLKYDRYEMDRDVSVNLLRESANGKYNEDVKFLMTLGESRYLSSAYGYGDEEMFSDYMIPGISGRHDLQAIQHVIDAYDSYIELIRFGVELRCKQLGIDFHKFFEDVFSQHVVF